AHTPAALAATITHFRDFLNAEHCHSLHDLCYSAGVRRTHHAQRLAFVFRTQQALTEQLEAYRHSTAVASPDVHSYENDDGPVFVFSGQGAEFWPLDVALLTQFPIFREVLTRCEELLSAQGADWSLIEQLTTTYEQTWLHETDVCQAAIFACQVALAALWQSWGIAPAAVIGHSLGEVAAAHVAGALSLEQAITVVLQPGRITKQAAGKGRMALVGLSMAAATDAIRDYGTALSVAVSNSPTTSVLSGDPVALEAAIETLTERNVFVRRLPAIDYAAHSPQMEPLKHELAQALQGLTPRRTTIPFYSTVTTTAIDGTTLDAHYWANNLREPVQFSQTVQHRLSVGDRGLLEVHPTQVLLRPMQEIIDHIGVEAMVYPSLRRDSDGPTALLRTLGNLYSDGYTVRWEALYPNGGRHVSLPTTAWQRVRCWLPDSENRAAFHAPTIGSGMGQHPLVGVVLRSATQPNTYLVQTEVGPSQPAYLADHCVYSAAVVPAAAYIEMALAVAIAIRDAAQSTVTELQLEKALMLPVDKTIPIQIAVSATGEMLLLKYYSCPDGGADGTWVYHAQAVVQCAGTDQSKMPHQPAMQRTEPTAFQQAADATLTGDAHYQMMAAHGLHYGPCFQGIEQLWLRETAVLAKLNLPRSIVAGLATYQLHPVLLDLAFQSVAALLQSVARDRATELYLPVALKVLHIHRLPQQAVYAHAVQHPPQDETRQRLTADVALLDRNGQILVEAQGLVLQPVAKLPSAAGTDPDQHLYQVTWKHMEVPAQREPVTPGRWLMIGNIEGVGHSLAEQFRRADQECLLWSSQRGVEENTDFVDDEMSCQLNTLLAQTDKPLLGIVYLAVPVSTESEAGNSPTEQGALLGLLRLVQLLAHHHGKLTAGTQTGARSLPHLWIVTRAAQAVTEADSILLNQMPLWGLARTVNLELPQLRCCNIDLQGAQVGPAQAEASLLYGELLADGAETQIAYREGRRLVARLARYAANGIHHTRPALPGEAVRLETAAPGILDKLQLAATERKAPAPDQVEIRVHSAGINFLDVLSALGLRPDQAGTDLPLGMECAGTVTRVGAAVTDLQIGDEVLAVAPYSIANFTCTKTTLVRRKPEIFSFQEAAAIPIAYLTAYYALQTMGRLRKGERVLIHAAAGGVGLAAVYLAQHRGAEIYATAGSEEKRIFLRELGVPHVMDSRSLHFADEVMASTQGEGIDLVLNSLAGEAIPKSLALLRTNGRFLEIGKRDIYGHSNLDMGLLKRNIAFFAIDLLPLMAKQPAFCAELLDELIALLT
ncbi:MAG: acyltransferase domain-containing protein, partial [Caldilineaceae bacterium]|nr:acyltransferase domain-containing protein [Caldilineaceae bacterium]